MKSVMGTDTVVKIVNTTKDTTVSEQGRSAANNGISMEKQVENIIESNGGITAYWKHRQTVNYLFDSTIIFKNVPYTGIYGTNNIGDHMLVSDKLDNPVRIEVRSQLVRGSVDEKLPYLLGNCVAFDEKDVIIVLEGNGCRPGARQWLIDSAKAEKYKNIQVMTLDEFSTWVENTL